MLRVIFFIGNVLLSGVLVSGLGFPPRPMPSMPPPPTGQFSVPQTPTGSPPTPVDKSNVVKTCPAGFEFLGKECVQVVTIPATPVCPPGSELTPDGVCAMYVGKNPQCPTGFNRLGNTCERRETSAPLFVCGPGYTLTDADECTAPIESPPEEICVGGSVRKGDLCLLEEELEPELTCPPGYTNEGKICRIEELYNCTPEREPLNPTVVPPTYVPPTVVPTYVPPTRVPPTLPTVPFTLPTFAPTRPPSKYPTPPPSKGPKPPVYKGKSGQMPRPTSPFPPRGSMLPNYAGGPFRRAAGYIPPAESKGFVPERIDYVVQATCKRIRTIAAQKLCARGILNGKMCRVETEVPPEVVVPNAIGQDTRPPERRCPNGFGLASRTTCLLSQLQSLVYTCPPNTVDIGDRCATYMPPTPTCPPGYALENQTTCVQTLHAPPIVEFTVRFACTGKDCDQGQKRR